MSQLPKSPFPRALQMPLRDILRGVSTVAEMTEEALEPAAALLPEPLRGPFRSALAAVEQAGARATSPSIDASTIAEAASFLAFGQGDAETLVRVLAFGWDRLHAAHPEHPLLFSETVAATTIATRGRLGALPPYARAAAILGGLRQANAAGRFPGTPVPASKPEQVFADQALVSVIAWLFAERPPSLVEDMRLLELSFALTRALGDEVLDSLGNSDALARQLQTLADHI